MNKITTLSQFMRAFNSSLKKDQDKPKLDSYSQIRIGPHCPITLVCSHRLKSEWCPDYFNSAAMELGMPDDLRDAVVSAADNEFGDRPGRHPHVDDIREKLMKSCFKKKANEQN
jgi:hypothetical protein